MHLLVTALSAMTAPPAPAARPVVPLPGLGGRGILAAQLARLAVRLGSAAALARLLAPEAYGLHGMAAAVFGFLHMARDGGTITAIQQPGLTPQRFNALCRLALGSGLALALVGAALAVPAGRFFGEPTLLPAVLAAMSAALVFSGAAAPAIGVLYREGRAGRVAVCETAAFAAGALAAVVIAWRGGGVWALVALTLVGEAALCVLVWAACPWRPGRDTGGARWGTLAAVGASLGGSAVAGYAMRILDQVTVGRAAGAAALGLYGRGAQIAALPVQFGLGPFGPWILAELGRRQHAAAEFAAFFRRALNGLLHISFAGAAVCIAVPELPVLVLFGERWLGAAPVVRWLGVGLAVQPWAMAPGWLLGATGAVRPLAAWSAAGVALLAAGCVLAYQHGPHAVALAAGGAAVLHAALGPGFCRGRTPVTLADWLVPAAAPAVVWAGLGAVLCGATRLAPGGAGEFAVPLAAAAVYGAAMWFGFPRLKRELRAHLFFAR